MITVVVPTYGREAFTERFKRFHSTMIYGGSPHTLFVTPSSPDPKTYFATVRDALHSTTNPYIMLADNDDFLIWPGVQTCLNILRDFPDYVACGGRIGGFATKGNKPYGKIIRYSKYYSPWDRAEPYTQADPQSRVTAGFWNSWSYYAVHRAEVIRRIWDSIVRMGITDLQLHERYCALALLKAGKVMGIPEPSYFRQYNTSIQWPNRNDFPKRLMTGSFTRDRDAILADLAPCVVTDLWATWWDAWLKRNYGPAAAFRRTLKHQFPTLAKAWRNRYRPHWIPMQKHGADIGEAVVRDFLRRTNVS